VLAGYQRGQRCVKGVGRGRAAGQKDVHRYELVNGPHDLEQLGTTTQGICCWKLAFSMYARSRIASGPMGLRIEGTLPVMAAIAHGDQRLGVGAHLLDLLSSSTDATAPSTKAMSTSSGNSLASTSGL